MNRWNKKNYRESSCGKYCEEKFGQYKCIETKSCALVIPFDDDDERKHGVAALRKFLNEEGDCYVAAAFDASTNFDSDGNITISSSNWEYCGAGVKEIPTSFIINDRDSANKTPHQCKSQTLKRKPCKRTTNHSSEICWQHRPNEL